jgi:predicted lactoylglutathione lyase
VLRDRARAVRHARQPRDVRERRRSRRADRRTSDALEVSFDLGSREAVDELVERAGAAGGRIGDTDDYPFMYQRQFDDPDGYHYSPFWMKPDADPTA